MIVISGSMDSGKRGCSAKRPAIRGIVAHAAIDLDALAAAGGWSAFFALAVRLKRHR
jgi:uncharacterized membrane protein